MSKVPKMRSFEYFCNILRKKYCNGFCVVLWYKTFRYFTWVQSCLFVTCFCLLWLAMEFMNFTVLRNSKYKQTDQNNFSCFFLLILNKSTANKAAIFVFQLFVVIKIAVSMVRDIPQFSKSMSSVTFTVMLISTLIAWSYDLGSGLLQKNMSRHEYTMLEDFQWDLRRYLS